MENKILKLLLVTSLSYNATFLYSFLMFPNGLQERQKSSWSRFFPIPKVRNGNDHEATLSVGTNKTSTKDQFTLLKARSLIKRAYKEAIEVNEFVRKYFRKDMDLKKKAVLEEDYLRNYLPFNDLSRIIKSLVDVIHNESQKELSNLGNEVQKRIHKLQNPSDCKTAKKLVCKIPPCGLGCQHHHIGNCLLAALGTNRVMLVDYSSVSYPGIQKVFLPLSDTCSMEDLPKQVDEWKGELQESYEHIQVVRLDLTHEMSPNTRFKGLTIPKFLQEKVEFLHDDPNMWWIGQIMGYLLRPRSWIFVRVQEIKRKLNLTHPYVSIHVRRTDKLVKEARKFEIEEYMDPVVAWYDSQVGKASNYTRRVYVASDDLASVIPDAHNKGDDLERFIYLFKSYCRLTNFPEEEKKAFLLASIEETLLLELDDTAVRKGDFDDLVYLIELAVDRQSAVFRMRRSFFRTCQLDHESACDFVSKVKTLGKRAYPAEDDEQVLNFLMFLCVVKGLRDPQQVMQLPDRVFDEKDFDALCKFLITPQTALLKSNTPDSELTTQINDEDITTEIADVLPAKQELNLALKYPNSALLVSHPGFPDSVHQVLEDNATSWEVVVANVVSGKMIRLSLTTWNSPTVDSFVDVFQSLSTCCYQFSALHLSGTTLRDLSWDVG
ncbi:unnamed protein product [Clavelina lepadiformis]|uniref:GT23 domain-containing protein n=1 Tax=Clavelina lepadiformis TaxID=159417 RepID=A0ABP0FQX9_CLALP